jgi:hypothetical protein
MKSRPLEAGEVMVWAERVIQKEEPIVEDA